MAGETSVELDGRAPLRRSAEGARDALVAGPAAHTIRIAPTAELPPAPPGPDFAAARPGLPKACAPEQNYLNPMNPVEGDPLRAPRRVVPR
jgi:hypothetical protein